MAEVIIYIALTEQDMLKFVGNLRREESAEEEKPGETGKQYDFSHPFLLYSIQLSLLHLVLSYK